MSGSDTGEPIVVGAITAPFGIHGWVKVRSFTDPPARLFAYDPLYRRRDGRLERLELIRHSGVGRDLRALIRGCDDRDAAAALVHSELVVTASALAPLAPDEYYWHQLIGLSVYARGDDGAEQLLGAVDHLLETGANDVLVVRGNDHSTDRRERLIPWLPGQVVMDVDLEAGRMIVDWDPAF